MRCAIVALVGAPNAGKSTLLNQLVGQKLSIVTHKAQTTRAMLRAVAIEGDAQLVFVDTPGIFEPGKPLERAMVAAAWSGARDADIVVLIVDAAASQRREDSLAIARALSAEKRRIALVLNKIDLMERPRLLEIAAAFDAATPLERTFMISALTGDGLADLKSWLAAAAPQGPWLFPEDQITDLPVRLLAAEITREKLFLKLHEELPYSITVETEEWKDLKDGSARIGQIVYVERDSQKKIVLGRGGRQIKDISIEARRDIAALIERPVHLFLFVKVRPKWAEDPARLREIGLGGERES